MARKALVRCASSCEYVNADLHVRTGKRSFLCYLLVKRLLKRQPTCLQTEDGTVYHFSAKGVVRYAATEPVPEFVTDPATWLLVDGIAKDTQPNGAWLGKPMLPIVMVCEGTRKPAQWLRDRLPRGAELVMSNWSREELYVAGYVTQSE